MPPTAGEPPGCVPPAGAGDAQEPPGCAPQGAPARLSQKASRVFGTCCARFCSIVPRGTACVIAAALTAFIIGGGFVFAAPVSFAGTVLGPGFWYTVSWYLTLVVVTNFYLGVTTSPEPTDGSCGELCRQCGRSKPARTHHCSTCGRCCAEMDHHCVFLNNCVGVRNQRFFLRFVLAVGVSCFYVAMAASIPALREVGMASGAKIRSMLPMRLLMACTLALPSAMVPAALPYIGAKNAFALSVAVSPGVGAAGVLLLTATGVLPAPPAMLGAAVAALPLSYVLCKAFDMVEMAAFLGVGVSTMFCVLLLGMMSYVHSRLSCTLLAITIASLVVSALTIFLLYYHVKGVLRGRTQFELLFKIKVDVPETHRGWSNMVRLLSPPVAGAGWFARNAWWVTALSPVPLPCDWQPRPDTKKTV